MVKGELRRVSETATCRSGAPRRQPPQDGTGGAAVVDFQRLRCNTTSCLLFFCLGMLLSYFAHFLQALLRSFFSPIGIVHGATRRRSRTPFGGRGTQGGPRSARLARPLWRVETGPEH